MKLIGMIAAVAMMAGPAAAQTEGDGRWYLVDRQDRQCISLKGMFERNGTPLKPWATPAALAAESKIVGVPFRSMNVGRGYAMGIDHWGHPWPFLQGKDYCSTHIDRMIAVLTESGY